MKPRYFSTAVLVAVTLSLSGCVQRLGDLTVVSSQNIRVGSFDASAGDFRQVEAKDCRHIILFIPIGGANIETALDKALAAGNGNFMTDAVIETTFWYFLYGQTCYRVRGKVWTVQLANLDASTLRGSEDSTDTHVVVRFRDSAPQTGKLLAWTKDEIALQDRVSGQVFMVDRRETTGVYLASPEQASATAGSVLAEES